jgi:hypothetical protein
MWKVVKEKCQITYKGKSIKITSDCSPETNPKSQESVE